MPTTSLVSVALADHSGELSEKGLAVSGSLHLKHKAGHNRVAHYWGGGATESCPGTEDQKLILTKVTGFWVNMGKT